jgi:hypothetical protein
MGALFACHVGIDCTFLCGHSALFRCVDGRSFGVLKNVLGSIDSFDGDGFRG